MEKKGNAAIGGQIPVPDAGPSAHWLNWCFVSNHLSNSRNQYEMSSSPLFEVVLLVLWAKYYFLNCFITLDSLGWYFQYFYCEKQLKNPSKTTFLSGTSWMSEHPELEFAPQTPRSPILPSVPPLVLFIISMVRMVIEIIKE